ncbi:MAG: glycosyltransferase family 4 protein [Actinomycetes bacterium]
MHILVVHNRYRAAIPSGENNVVDFEIAALREAGIEVTPYLRSSDELTAIPLGQRIRLATSPIHGRDAVAHVEQLIKAVRPDILHLHNPYPLISMSVVRTAKRHGLPVVQTVHNHRHTCMKGTYQRGGRDCRDCLTARSPWPGVVHACYRDSHVQSAVMAAALRRHKGTFALIDRLIALTPEIEKSLQESGFDPARITIKANSVPDPGPPEPLGHGFAYVGRLSEEKGVLALLDAWCGTPPGQLGMLKIAGDGPAHSDVERIARTRDDLLLLGRLQGEQVRELMNSVSTVVVPSLWPEALPLVVLESLALGRPLLVTNQGGLPTAVDGSVGCVVEPTLDGLTKGLLSLAADRERLAKMGHEARARYESRFHPATVTRELVSIYNGLLASPM